MQIKSILYITNLIYASRSKIFYYMRLNMKKTPELFDLTAKHLKNIEFS